MIAGGFEYAIALQALRGEGQDRAAVFERDGGVLIALADGAGGTSNGEIAARAVIETAETLHAADADWCVVLRALDSDAHRLDGGQTTAVVLRVGVDGIAGASVGDSEAWLAWPDGRVDVLTQSQHAKPLVGSGAHPVAASSGPLGDATLVVASDGLFRYARAEDIARVAVDVDLKAAAEKLLELARLPTGNVLDDVAIVLCRVLVV
jgi:serine/threonine protein phosphatase PrpC